MNPTLQKILRTLFFMDFFKAMFDAKDNSVSSTRFIAVFSGILLPVSWVLLSFYCAANKIGMPGGSTEGFIGLFTIATLGRAYTSYTEMKAKANGNSQDGQVTTIDNNTSTHTVTTENKKDDSKL